MIGYFIVGYILMAFVAFIIFWPMMKVASDADDQMEEMLKERKAENESKLNK